MAGALAKPRGTLGRARCARGGSGVALVASWSRLRVLARANVAGKHAAQMAREMVHTESCRRTPRIMGALFFSL